MGVQLTMFKNTSVSHGDGKLWEAHMRLGTQRQKCSDANKPVTVRLSVPSVQGRRWVANDAGVYSPWRVSKGEAVVSVHNANHDNSALYILSLLTHDKKPSMSI